MGLALLRGVVAGILLAVMAPCYALDPGVRLQHYNHAIWTGKDGLPPGIRAMAQTPDGWLWLGTRSGLFQFDGLRFERRDPPGGLLSPEIIELGAEQSGDLWIGYERAGASVLHTDGSIEHFPTDLIRRPNTITVDVDGSVWFGCLNGIFHLAHGAWKKIGSAEGVVSAPSGRFMRDQYDTLWLTADEQLYRYDRTHRHFIAQGPKQVDRILLLASDGRLWTGRAKELRLLPPDAGVKTLPRPASFNRHTGVGYGLFDRDGNFWTGFCPRGVCMIHGAAAMAGPLMPETMADDRLDQSWQLSSLSIGLVLEDREGNIWLVTPLGLERFRENKVQSFAVENWTGNISMAVGRNGRAWVADGGSSQASMLPLLGEPDALAPQPYDVVAPDRDGNVLLGDTRAIVRSGPGETMRIPYPPNPAGYNRNQHTIALFDDGTTLWANVVRLGKFGWTNGRWTETQDYAGLPPDTSLIVKGSAGRLWFARTGGHLFASDAKHALSRYEPMLGDLSGIYDDGHEVIVGGSDGLALLQQGRFIRLHANDAADLDNISGMLVTFGGDHWFNGSRGLLHVRAADWQALLKQPETALRYDLIDALDGYEGGAGQGRPSLVQAGDARLWFATTAGVARLDPRHLTRNPVAPRVFVTAIGGKAPGKVAGTGATEVLRLPPGSSHFNVDFTATSLRKPERIRFHYQLVGVDSGWQDAGTRRSAYYTNVAAGSYHFRVVAVNEDGVASDSETVVAFEVAPTLTQTWWWRLLVVIAALALLYWLYRYRLRRATQRTFERLNVRVAERERIARDLHDTLLQSVQGIILKVHAMSMRVPSQEPLRRAMEETVSEANDALVEGRDRVRELRAENQSPQALADALRVVGAAYAGPAAFMLTSEGRERILHPVVHDELLAMGRECLLNAFRHAGAESVRVRLIFGAREICVTVADDGVGIPAGVVAARGREGHWGLVSLYERARRIQAQLTLETTPGAGTTWSISVAAALAYRVR